MLRIGHGHKHDIYEHISHFQTNYSCVQLVHYYVKKKNLIQDCCVVEELEAALKYRNS